MAGQLTTKAVFGVKGNVRDNVHYAEDGAILYPAGNFVVKYNTGTGVQEFIPCREDSGGITAMALSTSRRYACVAERMDDEKGAILTVYNVRTQSSRRVMRAAPHVRAAEFVSIGFNLDDTLVIALGGAPYYQVAIFSVEKGRCIAVSDGITTAARALSGGSTPVPCAVSFSPVSLTKAVLYGADVLTFYTIEEMAGAAPAPASAAGGPSPPGSAGAARKPSALAAAAAALDATGGSSSGSGATGDDADAPLTHTLSALAQNTAFQTRAARLGGGVPASDYTAHTWLGDDVSLVGTGSGDFLVFKRDQYLRVMAPADMAPPALPPPSSGTSRPTTAGGFAAHSAMTGPTPPASAGGGAHPRPPGSAGSHMTTSTAAAAAAAAVSGATTASDARAIYSMVAYSRGFLAGGEDGCFRIYEYSDPEDSTRFTCIKSLTAGVTLECDTGVRALAISPSEERAALAVSGSQLYQVNLAHANLLEDSSAFAPLGPGSHAPPSGLGCKPGDTNDVCGIVSMDVAVRRPLIATVGTDNTVRVWNYAERSCEVTKVFPEGPTAIAFHPSGLHLLIGFTDKLRLMNLLMDDIREVREFPLRACSEVRFSHGGDLLAAVHGNVVQLYSVYTGEYLHTLRGHTGRITCVRWAYNDATLYTCSVDGAVYEWSLADAKRARDFFSRGVKWASIDPCKDGSSIYAVGDGAGPDGTQSAVREIDMNTGLVVRELVLPNALHGLHFVQGSSKMLFAASSSASHDPHNYCGNVLALPHPLPVVAPMSTRRTGRDDGGSAPAAGAGATASAGAAGGSSTAAHGAGHTSTGHGSVSGHHSSGHHAHHHRTSSHGTGPGSVHHGSSGGAAGASSAGAAGRGASRTASHHTVMSSSSSMSSAMSAGAPGAGDSPEADVAATPEVTVRPYQACAAPVMLMRASHDDSTLFAGGADGSIVVFEVRDRDGRVPASEAVGGGRVPWSEEVMVTLTDLEEKKTAVRELRDQVAELQSNNDYALRMQDIAFQERVKALTERYTSALDTSRAEYEALRDGKAAAEKEWRERVAAIEVAHRSELQKREALYQGRVMDEVERYQSLQADVEAQRTLWQNKRNAMIAAHNHYIAALTADYERRLEGARDRRRELGEDLEGVKRDWAEMRSQMEADLDREVELMKRGYSEKLDGERDATLKYKGENGILVKKWGALTKEKDDVCEEIKRMTEKQKSLYGAIGDLEKEIGMLRVSLHEKDVGIAEKEKRIYELKKKNQELEKYKFVLDFKIRELKQQIEPRENEIAAMRKQIREVDAELEAYHKSNAELDEDIGRLRAGLDALQTQAAAHRATIIHDDGVIRDFSAQLHTVIHTAHTPEALHGDTKKLAALYAPKAAAAAVGATTAGAGSGAARAGATATVSSSSSSSSSSAPSPTVGGGAGVDGLDSAVAESHRQREHLTRQLAETKSAAAAASASHKRLVQRLVAENLSLIDQVKELRSRTAAIKTAMKCWKLDRARAVNTLQGAGLVHLVPTEAAVAAGAAGDIFSSPGGGLSPRARAPGGMGGEDATASVRAAAAGGGGGGRGGYTSLSMGVPPLPTSSSSSSPFGSSSAAAAGTGLPSSRPGSSSLGGAGASASGGGFGSSRGGRGGGGGGAIPQGLVPKSSARLAHPGGGGVAGVPPLAAAGGAGTGPGGGGGALHQLVSGGITGRSVGGAVGTPSTDPALASFAGPPPGSASSLAGAGHGSGNGGITVPHTPHQFGGGATRGSSSLATGTVTGLVGPTAVGLVPVPVEDGDRMVLRSRGGGRPTTSDASPDLAGPLGLGAPTGAGAVVASASAAAMHGMSVLSDPMSSLGDGGAWMGSGADGAGGGGGAAPGASLVVDGVSTARGLAAGGSTL